MDLKAKLNIMRYMGLNPKYKSSREYFENLTEGCAIFGSVMMYACGFTPMSSVGDLDLVLLDHKNELKHLYSLQRLRNIANLDVLKDYLCDDVINIIYKMCEYDDKRKCNYEFAQGTIGIYCRVYTLYKISSTMNIDFVIKRYHSLSAFMDSLDMRAYRLCYYKGKVVKQGGCFDDINNKMVRHYNFPFKTERYEKLKNTYKFPNFFPVTSSSEEYVKRRKNDRITKVKYNHSKLIVFGTSYSYRLSGEGFVVINIQLKLSSSNIFKVIFEDGNIYNFFRIRNAIPAALQASHYLSTGKYTWLKFIVRDICIQFAGRSRFDSYDKIKLIQLRH